MRNIGHTIIDLAVVDSTNLYAERLLTRGEAEEGLVISAASQTAGKGQGDNRWESQPGRNLTFSVVLQPRFLEPGRQFLINQAISLGVVDFLSCYVDGIAVKWPNDILAGGKKIGGILIRHRVEGAFLESSIAGIGININQAAFDPHLPRAVSLVQILGRELDLREALELLCEFLDQRYSQLRNGRLRRLESDFTAILLGMDEERDFIVAGETRPGTIRGVDEFGRILVKHKGKSARAYAHGEIEYLL